MSDIKILSLTDWQKILQKYYDLSGVTLVVCGVCRSTHYFGETHYQGINIEAEIPSKDLTFPPIKAQATSQLETQIEIHAPRVHMGFKAFSASDSRSVALECLDELLFEGYSSRVYKRLIFDEEIASCVYAVMPHSEQKLFMKW